jgi:hypothetical protein
VTSELDDLKASFGAPPDRDLPPGRHALHREYLMSCIVSPSARGADNGASEAERLRLSHSRSSTPGRSSFVRRPARRHMRAFIAVGAAAVVCAGITGYALTRSTAPDAQPAPATARTPGVQQAALAAHILSQASAQIARAGITAEPTPGQWIYTKIVSYEYPSGNQPASENWTTFDGSESAYFQDGHLVTHTSSDAASGSGVSAWAAWKEEASPYTAYELLKSLPASPRALLSAVGRYVREEGYSKVAAGNPISGITPTNQAQAEFDFLTDVLWNAAGAAGGPPAEEAAAFKAMAMLPGIMVQQNATEGAGAQVIAVSDDGYDQLLLDPKTYQVLGLRRLNRGTADIPVTGQDIPVKYRNGSVWAALSKTERDKILAQARQKLAKTWPVKGTVLESIAYVKVTEVNAPGDR